MVWWLKIFILQLKWLIKITTLSALCDFLISKLLLGADFIKGWYLCQIEVLACKEVPWPSTLIEEKYHIEDSGWPLKNSAFECKINLLTGRTHQVCLTLHSLFLPFFFSTPYFSFSPLYIPFASATISLIIIILSMSQQLGKW